jgi:hypothetical protein
MSFVYNFTKKNSPRLLLLAKLSFAIDVQHDKRGSLQHWHPGGNWTIPHGTSLPTCFWWSACCSTSDHHPPKRVRSVRQREYEKIISLRKMFFAGRIIVCDRRAARQVYIVATLTSRLQLDHTTQHKSCHLLLVICMSFDEQSPPTETRSLCGRQRKRKNNFTKKEFRETVVAGRIVVCDRRAARQAQIVATLASRLQLDHTTRHQSRHLLRLIRMSFDAQSATNETRSTKEKRKK